MKKITLEEFIRRANLKHNNKYEYSKVDFNRISDKICIICPTHGEFYQKANNHLFGQGCPKCSGKGNTQEIIIEDFKKVHGDKYDYSKVEFKRVDKKVCIICPVHGIFWQEPRLHIRGCGCGYCSGKNMDTYEFIRKAKIKHGDKYDYTNTKYIDSKAKVCIICPKHGEFWQSPNNHLIGYGCQKCGSIIVHNKLKLSKDNFLIEAAKVHGNIYDYSKVEYYNIDTKIRIVCPKHGEFYQTPYKHLNGQGCPKCNSSHMEEEIRMFLIRNELEFEEQKRFEWLGLQTLDFYLPKYNIAIECQGEQHFKPTKLWGGEESFNKIIERDSRKKAKCNLHNIHILYYANYEMKFPYKVYTDKNDILKEINYIKIKKE